MSEAEVSALLAAKRVPEKQDIPPLNEPLYRKSGDQLEYLELIPEKQHLVVKRGRVGEIVTRETRKPTVPIKGFGTEDDNERKNKMAELLRNELPVRGLGSWTGDPIGSGTFEIGVRVADESLARRMIPELLRSHGLGDGVVIEEL